MEFSRQEYWNMLPFSTLRGSSQPRGQTFCLLHILCWQADSLLLVSPGIAASGPDHITSIKERNKKLLISVIQSISRSLWQSMAYILLSRNVSPSLLQGRLKNIDFSWQIACTTSIRMRGRMDSR